ncbi:DUF397 domain-containing protein [Streptomyces olivaceus]|nr:DUF397 domain-containing protein [Streptomyces olivaceus]
MVASEADAALAAVPGGAPQPGIALDLVHRPDGLAGAVGARLPPPVGGEGGDCMEIAAGTAAVHIRDSKAAAGPVLAGRVGRVRRTGRRLGAARLTLVPSRAPCRSPSGGGACPVRRQPAVGHGACVTSTTTLTCPMLSSRQPSASLTRSWTRPSPPALKVLPSPMARAGAPSVSAMRVTSVPKGASGTILHLVANSRRLSVSSS